MTLKHFLLLHTKFKNTNLIKNVYQTSYIYICIYIFISTVKCSWIATVHTVAKVDQHNVADTKFQRSNGLQFGNCK